MAARKEEFAWRLKYRELEIAARAIDELRTRLDRHDKIDSHEYEDLSNPTSRQSADHYVYCSIPQIDFEKLEALPKRESQQVWTALNHAMPDDCELDDGDDEQVGFHMRICSLDECDTCVAEYVETMLAALDLADNEDVYVQRVLNDPQVKRLLTKHDLLRKKPEPRHN
jgi:hypothetical protein